MIFDLHCHTKEGSIDSKVSIVEYIRLFKAKGYNGFMIADHNSYRGCRAWDSIADKPEYNDFTVIRGIEYDTKDAGHVLIIMPDGVYLKVLTIRGMRASKTIDLVHKFGGIIGLAHPYGVTTSSAMGFALFDKTLIKEFDFIETFNTCEFEDSNILANAMADAYGLKKFAGTDSHVTDYIGMAKTTIGCTIKCNNDLIQAVKDDAVITVSGTEREVTKKAIHKEQFSGRVGYRIYNRGIGKSVFLYRKFLHRRTRRDIGYGYSRLLEYQKKPEDRR